MQHAERTGEVGGCIVNGLAVVLLIVLIVAGPSLWLYERERQTDDLRAARQREAGLAALKRAADRCNGLKWEDWDVR